LPSPALAYTSRVGDWRLAAELSYSHPLGIWNDYEAAEKPIRSSDGYRSIGSAIAATRFLDPLALGLRLSARTGLPRPERVGSSAWPIDAGLSLYATEALNDSVAVNAPIDHGLSIPSDFEWTRYAADIVYSLSASVGAVLSIGDTSLRASLAKTLSGAGEPGRFALAASHGIKIGKER
jgi:hypothetical protein